MIIGFEGIRSLKEEINYGLFIETHNTDKRRHMYSALR